jgi:hypothetical protein
VTIADRPLRELHALAWWSLRSGHVVGVVALVDREHGYWKAYIGLGTGLNESLDLASIANNGVHVGETVARATAEGRFDELEFHAT